ncbi:MAG: pyridoxine 5'-phosphate synthase [Planctomycetaceae bacterium]|nr:pyridoxine 5'-phosphate synthase [Planctomycetaceae bacterium]MCP4463571.1 pyridoxine 5'-phosphate synthase [Planctomycetaceae bacterium]
MATLGVNIDHVATVRQARQTNEPDPVWAAALAQLGGADCITVHLREDRRHIQDRDLRVLKDTVTVKLNLECAVVPEMIDIACALQPEQVCLVPERREEVTTEGGLNVVDNESRIKQAVEQLQTAGIRVSLFIDATADQINSSVAAGADAIEIHTGPYANATGVNCEKELSKIVLATQHGKKAELEVHAGHGLTYNNVQPIASIAGIDELNIGHSIVSRSIFCGLQNAVREMKDILLRCSS